MAHPDIYMYPVHRRMYEEYPTQAELNQWEVYLMVGQLSQTISRILPGFDLNHLSPLFQANTPEDLSDMLRGKLTLGRFTWLARNFLKPMKRKRL